MGKKQHVVPTGSGWAVRGAGNERLTSRHDTKAEAEAEAVARRIAQNQRSEVVIHGRNGRIPDSDSYDNDPNPPRDGKH